MRGNRVGGKTGIMIDRLINLLYRFKSNQIWNVMLTKIR